MTSPPPFTTPPPAVGYVSRGTAAGMSVRLPLLIAAVAALLLVLSYVGGCSPFFGHTGAGAPRPSTPRLLSNPTTEGAMTLGAWVAVGMMAAGGIVVAVDWRKNLVAGGILSLCGFGLLFLIDAYTLLRVPLLILSVVAGGWLLAANRHWLWRQGKEGDGLNDPEPTPPTSPPAP